MIRTLNLLLWFSIFTGVACAQTAQKISNNWYYHQGDTALLSLSKSQVQRVAHYVQLPHTWNQDDAFDKYKPMYRGIGWYIKFLTIDAAATDQVYLKFEGVSLTAEVFVNGKPVTQHKGGYTAFMVNITPYIKAGTQNVIAVKANNKAGQLVGPVSADYTMYGGIYRDVWLIKKNGVHFSEAYGASSLQITTPQVSAQNARIKITGQVVNQLPNAQKVNVKHTVYSPEGKVVATLTSTMQLKAGQNLPFTVESKTISSPMLWHPNHPWLYRVKSEIILPKAVVADQESNKIGLRWFKLTGDKGFFINGEPLKLNGACRHQDFEGLGNALPNERHEQDMQLLKDMGANFTRLAHYPHAKAVLDACDRLGIIVWMETPNVNVVDTAAAYAVNSKTQQVEMVRQNINHASIVFWGYMNEIFLSLGRTVKDTVTEKKFVRQTQLLATELEKVTKEQDPTRLTATAFHGADIYNKYKLGGITNLVGWNLYSGWYGNDFNGLDRFLDEQHKRYPERALLVSEYGAGSDARINSLVPEQFDFSMQWQQKYIEYYLPAMQKRPWLAGSAAWILADFGSEMREETMPRINNKGIVFFNRVKKDVYYYYQAFFQTAKPVLHIATRDWAQRKMQLQADADTTVTNPVKVYTNGQMVQLYCNGKLIGQQPVTNCYAEFKLPFANGDNKLEARAVINNTKVSDNAMVQMQLYKYNLQLQPRVSIGVNCGSNAWYHDTDRNYIFEPDQPYQKGSWGYIGGQVYRPVNARIGIQSQIALTNQDALYQTLRSNAEAYQFDVADGNYEVTLEFAEPSNARNTLVYDIGAQSNQTKQQRVFNVMINNQSVIQSLDLEGEYGVRTLVKKAFVIRAADQQGIRIAFSAVKGQPIVNAIKVQQLP